MSDQSPASVVPGGIGTPLPAAPREPPPRGRRRLWALAALLVAASSVGLAVSLLDRKQEREARTVLERQAAVSVEIARLRRVQSPHRGSAPSLLPVAGASREVQLAARSALVGAARRAILLDARKRAARGELDGPIVAVTCGTFSRDPESIPDDRRLTRRIGRYDCLAVKRSGAAGVNLGHPFVAALDFRRFSYAWCRDSPTPSERGQALAFVRLERECLAAHGKPLGTGYAAVPQDKR